jgi:hypothetical protein
MAKRNETPMEGVSFFRKRRRINPWITKVFLILLNPERLE